MEKATEPEAGSRESASRKSAKPNGERTERKGGQDLATPTDLDRKQVKKVADALNGLVADAFALYFKTKSFHWHVSGPNFRDYHVLIDEQAMQIFATIDPLAERVRKLGEMTVRSLGEAGRLTSVADNDADFVAPSDMIAELLADNRAMLQAMRQAKKACEDAEDAATSAILDVYIDETERRIWFLFETSRSAERTGH